MYMILPIYRLQRNSPRCTVQYQIKYFEFLTINVVFSTSQGRNQRTKCPKPFLKHRVYRCHHAAIYHKIIHHGLRVLHQKLNQYFHFEVTTVTAIRLQDPINSKSQYLYKCLIQLLKKPQKLKVHYLHFHNIVFEQMLQKILQTLSFDFFLRKKCPNPSREQP